jgi:hypothetical protein
VAAFQQKDSAAQLKELISKEDNLLKKVCLIVLRLVRFSYSADFGVSTTSERNFGEVRVKLLLDENDDFDSAQFADSTRASLDSEGRVD